MTKTERAILWRKNNKTKWEETKRKYESSEKGKAARHQQYARNRSRELARTALYKKKKLKEDLEFKLKHRIRNRISVAIKNNAKAGSAVVLLGCSITQFKSYLESRFKVGMTWENYGEWHMDHIVPLARFDLTDKEQLKIACHYSNLQPLWKKENLAKGTKDGFNQGISPSQG